MNTPTPSCPFCGVAPRQMANHAVACGFVVCCETPNCPLDSKYFQLDAWSRRAKPAESALHKAASELEHFMSTAVRAGSLELKADDVGADGLTERLNALREVLKPSAPPAEPPGVRTTEGVPDEFVEWAWRIGRWFDERFITNWRIGPCHSAPLPTPPMDEADKEGK